MKSRLLRRYLTLVGFDNHFKLEHSDLNLKQIQEQRDKSWDRIKGLKLRCINVYCGGAAVHEVPQYMTYFFIPHALWLVYCSSYLYSCCSTRAAVHETPSSTAAHLLWLVYCSSYISPTTRVSINAMLDQT